MKKLLLTLSLVLHLEASSYELKVHDMKRSPGMDNQFRLENVLGVRAILDCQSFVQGLSIGVQPDFAFYLIEPFECEELKGRLLEGLRHSSNYCLDLDDIIRSDYPCQ